MGSLEKEIKKKVRLAKIQKAILFTVAAIGALSSPLAAAMILKELKKGGWKTVRRDPRYSVNESLSRLLKSGFVYFEQTDKGKFLRLTKEGGDYLRRRVGVGFGMPKPRKWDGKWRIVIFDIREKRKELREKLRNTLRAIGFIHLQHSVWVCPYDCEDLIALLKADFRIGKDILYIIADKIENDAYLRSHFDLK
ncbi:MAG: CRISPR-associated endonuclease Cas2 [Candidatus Taylorbacteria bacterium RIFCSPHIGHO2_02_49_25]|uniref:CRISPR-associated endonuclease Cas2 n=1 Tax=Candidatus Taylorbacteria bacterium RIFCSPHIGHO2_02_49_25 TaxID=1802305 RepID=A0A1G2MFZ4_9BACT|nr:MAG: hypothetical protein UY62_C0018G0001 [Parcubacteria group bacterium GW2011_GWF2_50_9]OHA21324.1 MAG: CRISPR-associated endonuclease Cas2 [Candidatus Taylorbacteria bacterium RIFCSPHIGHO2_01_FULL_49_60]OHA21961.1 MAG: CRISPR-associated endonuclease Cas2 [Candidatus Taylorbacteria bacterium RIFCSPHIGHO2_02_49_25]OHA36888.1 MAG: CRISPR-associated endonuclease Cas2 [Candidatus Taylorbacteria bacterium RIFCSPLOWO2_01_FULL_50_130]OHA42883.1 MAG: CRISPR-associated endonuclease Cas2 [Candidatus